jgi:hypothetical protein
MSVSIEREALGGVIREILDASHDSAAKLSSDAASQYVSSLSQADYAAALSKQFDRRQLREVISELRRMLPALNREVFSETNLARLAKVASRFGAVLQAKPFADPKGLTLRGFYVNDRTMLRRPLVCVNTACHRVGTASAFWHEMGHHLSREIFGGHTHQLNLSLAAGYQDHLSNPDEIVADAVMVLGGYPKTVAERLFGTEGECARCDTPLLVSRAREYLRTVSGFEFPTGLSVPENLRILAAMIHVAKFRVTLLREYGI